MAENNSKSKLKRKKSSVEDFQPELYSRGALKKRHTTLFSSRIDVTAESGRCVFCLTFRVSFHPKPTNNIQTWPKLIFVFLIHWPPFYLGTLIKPIPSEKTNRQTREPASAKIFSSLTFKRMIEKA